MHESLAQAKSVASVCGLPLGNVKPDGKEVSQRQWKTIGDQNRPIYYFANARTPAIAWLALAQLATSHLLGNTSAWMLKTVMSDPAVQRGWLNPAYSGDVAGELKCGKGEAFPPQRRNGPLISRNRLTEKARRTLPAPARSAGRKQR
jgi:hypothetical protein